MDIANNPNVSDIKKREWSLAIQCAVVSLLRQLGRDTSEADETALELVRSLGREVGIVPDYINIDSNYKNVFPEGEKFELIMNSIREGSSSIPFPQTDSKPEPLGS
jgi:hypothetical protein